MTDCTECRRLSGLVGFALNDLGDARRKLRRAKEGTGAPVAERVREIKAELRQYEIELAAHQTECEVAQAPRKIKDVRRKAAPKPKPEKRAVEIDREAMTAALAVKAPPPTPSPGRNLLPVTGHCHTCERPISGERRYCGRCMARRLS